MVQNQMYSLYWFSLSEILNLAFKTGSCP